MPETYAYKGTFYLCLEVMSGYESVLFRVFAVRGIERQPLLASGTGFAMHLAGIGACVLH